MIDNEFKKFGWLINEVDYEHQRQIAKWGVQDVSAFEWLAYLTEEVGELAEAICEYEYRKGSSTNIKKEAIQVATLALKIAEMSTLISVQRDLGKQEGRKE